VLVFPSEPVEPIGEHNTGSLWRRPERRQAYGYLPGRRVSPYFDRYSFPIRQGRRLSWPGWRFQGGTPPNVHPSYY